MSVDVILGLQWGDEVKVKLLISFHPIMTLYVDFRVGQMRTHYYF